MSVLPYLLALTHDPFAIASVVLITATRLVLFVALRYPVWSAVLLHPLMVLTWGYIFLRSMWYTGVRRRLHWRGRTFDEGVRVMYQVNERPPTTVVGHIQ